MRLGRANLARPGIVELESRVAASAVQDHFDISLNNEELDIYWHAILYGVSNLIHSFVLGLGSGLSCRLFRSSSQDIAFSPSLATASDDTSRGWVGDFGLTIQSAGVTASINDRCVRAAWSEQRSRGRTPEATVGTRIDSSAVLHNCSS